MKLFQILLKLNAKFEFEEQSKVVHYCTTNGEKNSDTGNYF